MANHLYPPSDGYNRSPEEVLFSTRSRNPDFMADYAHDLGRQVMEGVLVNAVPPCFR